MIVSHWNQCSDKRPAPDELVEVELGPNIIKLVARYAAGSNAPYFATPDGRHTFDDRYFTRWRPPQPLPHLTEDQKTRLEDLIRTAFRLGGYHEKEAARENLAECKRINERKSALVQEFIDLLTPEPTTI